MNMTVLYYKKCSTYQKTLKWLNANGIQHQKRPIKEEHPSEVELKAWCERSGLPLKKFLSTSGNPHKEIAFKDEFPQMSGEEQLALLAADGVLVKCPLVVADNSVLTGFKKGEWEEKMM